MLRNILRYAALAGVIGVSACDLAVENPVSPPTEKVLASPDDTESLLGSYYRRWHAGMYGSGTNVWLMSTVMSFESYSSLNNFCMNERVGFPRAPNNNAISNSCAAEQSRVYFYMEEVVRVASNILGSLNDESFQAAATGAGWTPGQIPRAKAFAEFLRGLALGYLALTYHEAAVVSVGQAGDDPGQLARYDVVADSAFVAFENALSHASAAQTAEAAISIPQEWIPTTNTLNMANFARLIRSYRARIRANVARTPAERANDVNWAEVIADATAGIQVDHDNITDRTAGPFDEGVRLLNAYGLWHQMPPFIIGMADTSTSYPNWIAEPIETRGSATLFHLSTPDQRFPQGTSRAAQQADFRVEDCQPLADGGCPRYVRNRPANRDLAASWGSSEYDFVRFYPWAYLGDGSSPRVGPMIFFTKAELDLLEAEGQLRAGNFARAATLINRTRVANGGLNAVSPTAAGTPLIPTHPCVPRVPVNASPNGGGTTQCGDLMEALKYEKRLETSQTHFMAWFIEGRGWGDLPQGTPVDWATPYQDLQARRLDIYSSGSGMRVEPAGTSTYGW